MKSEFHVERVASVASSGWLRITLHAKMNPPQSPGYTCKLILFKNTF